MENRRSFGMWMLPSLKEAWFRVRTKVFFGLKVSWVMLVSVSFYRSGPNPSWEFFTPQQKCRTKLWPFLGWSRYYIWRRKDWPAKGGSFGFLGDFPVRHANLRWFPELFVLKASPIHWETSIAWAASKKIKGGLLLIMIAKLCFCNQNEFAPLILALSQRFLKRVVSFEDKRDKRSRHLLSFLLKDLRFHCVCQSSQSKWNFLWI